MMALFQQALKLPHFLYLKKKIEDSFVYDKYLDRKNQRKFNN